MSNISNSQAPKEYLSKAGHQFVGAVVNFSMFVATGVKWLFKNHPNYTWCVIVMIMLVVHIISSFHMKSERDLYSMENAELLDSINKINMTKESYTSMDNHPVVPLPIDHDTIQR